MNDLEILQLLVKAKEMGIGEAQIKAFKTQKKINPVPEMKPEEIVKPISPFDDLSDEEILYWSSPYYDEIQAKKELRTQQLKLEGESNGDNRRIQDGQVRRRTARKKG